MALALYRKYRPRTFAEVIGQEHVTEPLSQALRSGRLNHAYLFSGPRGCGKTSSARILARSLNCERGPTPDPCGECLSCRSLANDGAGSIDVIEIDAASHGGVDDARELREKAFFAPANSRYKIYVIDEAHMVSSAGFNALLKLVEEPPDYVKFIFATTEPDKVLGTIRSRTHHYPFRLIPPAVLRPYLQKLTESEGVTVEPSVLPLVVRAGGGSARDSLSILDQLIAGSGEAGVTYSGAVALLGVTDSALIDEMCDAIAAGQGAAAYATIDRVADAGHEPRRFASDLLERFRDLIILQQVPDAVAKGLIDGPAEQLEAMARQAATLGAATLSRCADILHNGLIEMRGTTAPRLLLELVTARMLLPGADVSTSALLQRLERLEQGIAVRGELPTSTGGNVDGSTGGAHSASAGSGGAAAGSGDAPGGASGGAAGGKAAAMAAARAALNRQSAGPARPVSAAPAAPVPPAVTPVSPASGGPASSPPAGSAGGVDPVSAPGSAGSGDPGAGAVPAGHADSGSAVGSSSSAAGSPEGVDSGSAGAEPDWNQVAAGQPPAPAEAGYYDDEPPPWDEEPPEPDDSVRPAAAAGRPPARTDVAPVPSASSGSPSGRDASGGAPDLDDAPAHRPDGRLERIRAAWQALGQHQPKVRAMQEYGIGVVAVDGENIVFAAPTQALMDRFLTWKDAIAGEFRKSPGGQWRIRCEVGSVDVPPARPDAASGRSGAGSRPGDRRDQSAAHQAAAGSPGRTAAAPPTGAERNTGRTESRPSRPQQAPAADADDEWPAQARAATPAGRGAGSPARDTDPPGPGRRSESGEPGSAHMPDAGRPGAAHMPAADRPGAARVPDAGRHGSARADGPGASGIGREDDSGWPEPARPGSSGHDDSTDDEWPEPVRPGSGLSSAGGTAAGDESAWPEPVRPGAGLSAESSGAGGDGPHGGASAAAPGITTARAGVAGREAPGGGAGLGGSGAGDAVRAVGGAEVADSGGSGFDSDGSSGPGFPGAAGVRAAAAGPGHGGDSGVAAAPSAASGGAGRPDAGGPGDGSAFGGAFPAAPREAAVAAPPGAGKPVPARSAAMEAARAAARMGLGAVARTSERVGSNVGAAAVGVASDGARGGVPGKPASEAFAQARAAAAGGGVPGGATWADGSPIGEAPYDPEYDGPPSGTAALEGFDPGDEPLDEVIDEKTARASSEEQVMQLLREAFGAEKIAEL